MRMAGPSRTTGRRPHRSGRSRSRRRQRSNDGTTGSTRQNRKWGPHWSLPCPASRVTLSSPAMPSRRGLASASSRRFLTSRTSTRSQWVLSPGGWVNTQGQVLHRHDSRTDGRRDRPLQAQHGRSSAAGQGQRLHHGPGLEQLHHPGRPARHGSPRQDARHGSRQLSLHPHADRNYRPQIGQATTGDPVLGRQAPSRCGHGLQLGTERLVHRQARPCLRARRPPRS